MLALSFLRLVRVLGVSFHEVCFLRNQSQDNLDPPYLYPLTGLLGPYPPIDHLLRTQVCTAWTGASSRTSGARFVSLKSADHKYLRGMHITLTFIMCWGGLACTLFLILAFSGTRFLPPVLRNRRDNSRRIHISENMHLALVRPRRSCSPTLHHQPLLIVSPRFSGSI